MKNLLFSYLLILSASVTYSQAVVSGNVMIGDVVDGQVVGLVKTSDFNTMIVAATPLVSYTISVQALTSSPVDAQTIYFGQLPKAPVTVASTSKVHIRKAGTLKMANIYCYSGTGGTAETWSMYIRVNNTTDYLIESISTSVNERIFDNSLLSIPLIAGDYFEIKVVNPTWVTNPLTSIMGGYVYIE